MDERAKAVVALASRLGDRNRPSLSPTRWHQFEVNLSDAHVDLAAIFAEEFDASSVPGIEGSIADAVSDLLESAAAATVEASDLLQHGIQVITIVDDQYPQCFREKLGRLAPPVLYCVGNVDLLHGDGIGVVGSRNIDEAGREAAEAVARKAVEAGRPVVSGGARGADSFAMNAAFTAGGAVVGVLADSLQSRIRSADILRAIDSDTICLVSQQVPSAGFTPAAAMSRNKLVYALTETTVVIATDLESGGTWAGATEALKKGYAEVAVWTGPGAGPGNDQLITLGGRPMASASDLFDQPPRVEIHQPEQLKLA